MVQGGSSGLRAKDLWFRLYGAGFRPSLGVRRLVLWVKDLGVQSFRCRVQGLRVHGFRFWSAGFRRSGFF